MLEDYDADIYGTKPTFDEAFPETPRKPSRSTFFSPETLGYVILSGDEQITELHFL
jgi:hypothetical protein